MAELERSLIAERVRTGLRNARAKGKRLGRPRTVVDVARVHALRATGAWHKRNFGNAALRKEFILGQTSFGARVSTRGICKLCTLEKDLQDSHFIGRAVYRKLMEPSIKNPQPVVITAKGIKQSPIQLRDDVFCFDCEQIFNSGGEAWMHGHIATTTGFRLLDLFTGQTPIFNEPDFVLYDAAKVRSVDCPAILEYGMGVFFKAAVHTWKFEDGTSSYIDLKPELTEALRKFVHREAPFPDDMVLTVCLSSKAKQFWGVIPPLGMQPQGTEDERYYFYVSGVYYCLLVGGSLDPEMKALAFNNCGAMRPILVGDEWADQALGIMRNLAQGLPASPKLKQGLKPKP